MPVKLLLLFLCTSLLPNLTIATDDVYQFTQADKAFLARFSLASLPALPHDPSNAIADSLTAAKFGKQLFFDTRLSANKRLSCASCHQPEKYFTDGLSHSAGLGITRRSAPTLLGAPWSPWQFWDGRKDSLWSQALGPMEHPDEQGFSRTELAIAIARHYPDQYQDLFGSLPIQKLLSTLTPIASPLGGKYSRKNWNAFSKTTQDTINRIFSNTGKALMAYQRQLKIPPSRFDNFINALVANDTTKTRTLLNQNEVQGLRLFMGKANCSSCHNGPLFTNFEFHNIGAPEHDNTNVDMGRFEGVAALLKEDFTCLSQWSDAKPEQCEEMRFLKRKGPELVGAFKTPSLRNIVATSPYMQMGQFKTLEQVLEHYNVPKPPFYDRNQHPNRPHFDILPLQLSEQDIKDIISFLNTLTSPLPESDPWWYNP